MEDVDLYALQSQGAYNFSHEGYATCRMTENTFRVNFNPGADDPLVYNLEIPLLKGSGEYEGLFQIIHFLDGDFSGKAEVDIQLGELDVLNAARGSFTAELTVNGKENTITGQFTCAYTDPFSLKDTEKNIVLRRPPKSAALTAISPASGGDEICRTGFITHGEGLESVAGHWLAMTLSDHNLRMRTMTKGDLTTLLGLHGQRLLLGDDEEAVQQDIMAAAGALDTDFLFIIKIDQVDETYVFTIKVVRLRDMAVVVNEQSTGPDMENVFFSGILDRVAQEMVHADLCGRIDPENVSLKAGETELITFHVTDLKGDPVRDAEDEFTPAECGDFDPPQGRVEKGEFETEFEAGELPGVCREQGEIREEPNPATLQGGFVFYVTGELEGSGADASIDFSTYGLVDHLTYQFGHEGCSRNLAYNPFTGGLITLAAETPHVFLGEKPFYLPAENDAEEQYALSVGPESVPGWMSVHLAHAKHANTE